MDDQKMHDAVEKLKQGNYFIWQNPDGIMKTGLGNIYLKFIYLK